MRILDTLSGQKIDFSAADRELLIYVCGVTPYAQSHIGHAMSYIVFDVLHRALEYRGLRVRRVQNFTDIDDKLIERANQRGVAVSELAEGLIADYFREMDALNVRRADEYPRATHEIPQIVQMVEGLIANDYAYESAGDVYYRVRKKAGYGDLKHQSLDELVAGARVEIDELKEFPGDFALWKRSKPSEPAWESPWGPGRPGWHIECSAMSLRYLGPQIDIHGGGEDLIFPHHTNERAQTEAYTNLIPFSRCWMHNALLRLDGEKMSKSLGNILSIHDALARWGADALRVFILSGHYRSPITATDEALDAAARGADRLKAAANLALPGDVGSDVDLAAQRSRFDEALDDDLNTPQALAVLFELTREINRLRDAARPCKAAQDLLRELAGVLGLRLSPLDGGDALAAAPFIELLVSVRGGLKAAKHYALADEIRSGLATLGIRLEDTPNGTNWRRE